MSDLIVWVHGDCLDPGQEALRRHEGAPALFVWDDDLLRRRHISLKRVLFIYECLLELPVRIRRGNVSEQLIAFAAEHDAATIATIRSDSPGFRAIAGRLRAAGLELIIYDQKPFIELPETPDLRRFSRYWRAAQQRL